MQSIWKTASVILAVRVFTVLTLLASAVSEADEWDYGFCYKEELLYLHTAINYDFDPDWQQDWEKELLKGKGIRFSFGSLTKRQLFHNEDVIVNQYLDRGWWFRAHFNWYGSRHLDTDTESGFVEFQKEILAGWFACVSADLKHNKEEIDGAFGILKTNRTRDSYSLIQICWDDLVYDKRNTLGGKTTKQPLGIRWLVRTEGESWGIFTQGKYSAGFTRDYKNPDLSPEYNRHEQQTNHADIKLIRRLTKRSRLEALVSLYHFDESKVYYSHDRDYSYLNTIYHGTLRYLFPVSVPYSARVELHGIKQYGRARGRRDYRYKRKEMLPAFFIKRSVNSHAFEVGYFSSFYGWDYDDMLESADYSRDDYVDKLKIGWTYRFNQKARIQLSLSHVMQRESFGGGNAQYMMFF